MEVNKQMGRPTKGWWWVAMVAAFMFSACGDTAAPEGAPSEQLELEQRTMPAPAGVIQGQIDRPNARIEFRTFSQGRLMPLQKVQSDENGAFTLNVKSDLAYDFHQLVVDGLHPMVLIMDPTYGIKVEASVPETGYITDATIEGSPESSMLAVYYRKAIPLQMQLAYEEQRGDKPAAQAIRMQLHEYAREWASPRAHLACALGAIEHLDPEQDRELMVSIMNANRSKMGRNEFFKYLEGNIVNRPKPRVAATPPPAKGQSNGAALGPGDAAPEIEMADVNGKIRKLSDLRGKVVLIDFWASWCGPCRRENPHVVNAYRIYGPRGFEVFSVSLDKTLDPWVKAIAQDRLEWPNHVSDLAGWNNAAAQAYGVRSIPHTVLIDAEGNIIARNLRGPALTAQLASMFP